MVASHYNQIWDCCCDHGLLGMALLSRQAAPNIHFVDIVPHLITELEQKLETFFSNSRSSWVTHCTDITKIELKQNKAPHLVVISGVGGDLMTEFIEIIYRKHSNMSIDFLLCPVHHQFTLREKLIELEFSLIDENLVEDNQRFYEIMLVSSDSNPSAKITSVGNKIWLSESTLQAKKAKIYRSKILDHYQRMNKSSKHNVEHIIEAYNNVKI